MFGSASRRRREEFEAQALVHLDALARTATSLCGSRAAGEDAVQDTYLQAWKYWNTFRPGTNCRSWLFRILFNVIKKKRRNEAASVSIEDLPPGNVLRFDHGSNLEAYEVLEVLAKLADEHRAVLLLVAVEEMTYKEAAFALGVPVGTVMSRLSRARESLRKHLGVERGQARPRAAASEG